MLDPTIPGPVDPSEPAVLDGSFHLELTVADE